MNFRSDRNQIKAESNMASISDLVFLLLIFFILLSTLIKPGIPVDPPSSKGSNFDNKAITTVTIDAENKFYINNNKISVPKEVLETKLADILNKMPENERAIVLNVDKKAEAEFMVMVLDISNMNKWKVGIATKNK